MGARDREAGRRVVIPRERDRHRHRVVLAGRHPGELDVDRDLDVGVGLILKISEHRERVNGAAARPQVARTARELIDALELVAHALLGRDRHHELARRDAERGP